MDTTHKSLLIRIRDHRDHEAWRDFHSLYAPFLYRYARKHGLSHEDAEDVRARCLDAVARHISSFEYQRKRGGFRNWLRRIVGNSIVDVRRKRRLPSAASHELREAIDGRPTHDKLWEVEWADARLRYCIEKARSCASDRNFHAFYLLVVNENSVDDVCKVLDMSPNQVYKAKSLVLKRIRGQIDAFDMDLRAHAH